MGSKRIFWGNKHFGNTFWECTTHTLVTALHHSEHILNIYIFSRFVKH